MNKYKVIIDWQEELLEPVEANNIDEVINKVCGMDSLFYDFYTRVRVEEIEEVE